MYIKVVSNSIRNRIYITECKTMTRERHIFSNSKDMTELLQNMRSYSTPVSVDPLEQGWDWNNKARFLVLYVQRDTGDDDLSWERLLLWDCSVFVMNDSGQTIDTARV